jgi:hypothetical protein
VSWFKSRLACSQCGGKRVDVRPNWKERDEPVDWRGRHGMGEMRTNGGTNPQTPKSRRRRYPFRYIQFRAAVCNSST